MPAKSGHEPIEHPLTGGDVAAQVVRIGATVRKPVTPNTPLVEAFLQHLHHAGFRHAPRSLGRDDQNRQILDFILGQTITEPESLTLTDLAQIAAIIKELHTVSASFAHPDFICHNDLGPWNLIRTPTTWVFIDFDGAGPSSRLSDFAYATQSIVHLAHGGNPQHDALRLRTFADAYCLTPAERAEFPQILLERTRFSHDFLRHHADQAQEPWATMYSSGQGAYWQKAAAYIEQNQHIWTAALA